MRALALQHARPQIVGMSDTVSIAHLTSRALIAVGGPEWQGFLQGLITQDVETMALGEVRFGALLTPQGRLLYDLFVVGRDDGVWLDVAAEHRDALMQRLMMYRLRAKVEIAADDTPVFAAFKPLPPAGRGWGGGGGGGASPSGSEPPPPTPSPQGGGGFVADHRLVALGWRGYGAYEPTADEITYEGHRLALGVPGPADWGSDKTYPIEANFDLLNGIDFKKGCFVGQETTSRMKRRGQIKSRMLPIRFEGPAPASGTEILAGDLRAGLVLSGAIGGAIALLRLDRTASGGLTADGRPVRVERPDWVPTALGEDVA